MRQLFYKEEKLLFNGVWHDFGHAKLRYGEKLDNHVERLGSFDEVVDWAKRYATRRVEYKCSFLKKIIAKVNEWPDDRLKITKRNFKSLEHHVIYRPVDCQDFTIAKLSNELPADQYIQYYIDHVPEVKGDENDVGVLRIPNM